MECTDIEKQITGWGRALTADELADLLAVSVKSIYKLAGKGLIPAFKVGTCLRFNPARVAAWVAEQ